MKALAATFSVRVFITIGQRRGALNRQRDFTVAEALSTDSDARLQR